MTDPSQPPSIQKIRQEKLNVVPTTTKEQQLAAQAAERAAKRREAQRMKKADAADKSRQWFVRCDKCDSPGLMLCYHPEASDHGEVYGPTDWFASYKAVETPYMTLSFPCQVCKAPLAVIPAGMGSFFLDEGQMQYVDSEESRAEREEKSQREQEEYKAIRESASRIQLVRGGSR